MENRLERSSQYFDMENTDTSHFDSLDQSVPSTPINSKKSFLVYKHNKYIVVPTNNIALFYVKHETTIIVTFDGQEYFVSYSLEQIQQLVSQELFYRLNRQYLINIGAVKEVEHYFARKLLVNPLIPFREKLLVSKEKARRFLDWLENR